MMMIGLIGLRDQVQVSRMLSVPFLVIVKIWMNARISSTGCGACSSLLVYNSRHSCFRAHSIVSGANSSLPPPHHRC
jgi:hypothetical protein